VAHEAAAQICKNARGRQRRHGPQGAHYRVDRHGGAQAFATDITDHDQDAAVLFGAYVEEVSAHVAGRRVDALDVKAWNIDRRRNQPLLQFARGFEFSLQRVAGAPLFPGLMRQDCCEAKAGQEEGQVKEVGALSSISEASLSEAAGTRSMAKAIRRLWRLTKMTQRLARMVRMLKD